MARKAVLTVSKGPAEGKMFAVEHDFVIGRGEDAQINPEDNSTSRAHAKLTIEKEGVRIADLESANGLFINKNRVKSHFLKEGDTITIGDTSMVFSYPIDPKARRRNFYIILLVIVAIGTGALLTIISKKRAEAARQMPVQRVLSQTYSNEFFGYKVLYPDTMEAPYERPNPPRPWMDEIWGVESPSLGNQLVHPKVILDGYHHMQLWETISSEHYEFIRLEVEVWDGLAKYHRLTDFSLTDKSFPTRTPGAVEFQERQVISHNDPMLGDYEEAEMTYYVTTLDDGTDVEFYIRQRCYIVGKRRYLVSAITNASMYDRTTQLFDEFFDNFTITPEYHETVDPTELIEEAKVILEEAGTYQVNKLPQRQYMAFVKFCEAARMLKPLDAPSAELLRALQNANSIRENLNTGLENKRKVIRDSITRHKFDDATRELEEILAIVDDNNPNTTEDDQDEWRVWTKLGQDSAKEKYNIWKRSGY